jgi:hypothetical protein
MSHLHPRQRGLVLTLFLVPQVGLRVPYVWDSVTDWLREPSDPIRFYGVLWFSIFTFIVIPFSILLGGAACVTRGSVESPVK